MGHLSEKISNERKERAFSARSKNTARAKSRCDEPLEMLRDWTTRLGSEYLEKQTIFEPYPGVLGSK